jgi:phospholipid transport system substrate-binding protein
MTRAIFLVSAVVALCFSWVSTAHATPKEPAGRYVEQLGNQALEVITNKKFSKEQKQQRLEKIFAENVDIAWVARFVMGRFWRTATDEQKQRYVKEYQKFLIKHYTARFAEYSGGSFAINDTRAAENEGEYIVSMQITSQEPGAQPVMVDYRVRRDNGGFRIFDVVVEGVSMITTQRSEFSSVLNAQGIDALIGKLGSMSAPDLAPRKG